MEYLMSQMNGKVGKRTKVPRVARNLHESLEIDALPTFDAGGSPYFGDPDHFSPEKQIGASDISEIKSQQNISQLEDSNAFLLAWKESKHTETASEKRKTRAHSWNVSSNGEHNLNDGFEFGVGTLRLSQLEEEQAEKHYESRKRKLLGALLESAVQKFPNQFRESTTVGTEFAIQESPASSARKMRSPRFGGVGDDPIDDGIACGNDVPRPQDKKKKLIKKNGKSKSFTKNIGEIEETCIPVINLKVQGDLKPTEQRASRPIKKKKCTRKGTVKSLEDSYNFQDKYIEAEPAENSNLINMFRQKKKDSLQDIQSLDSQIKELQESLDRSEEIANFQARIFQRFKTVFGSPLELAENQSSTEANQRVSTVDSSNGKCASQRKSVENCEDPVDIFLESDAENEVADDSMIEELNKAYTDFNKKTFKDRADHLFQRGMLLNKRRQIIHEKAKKLKEELELQTCSFKPQINDSFPVKRVDIVTKTKIWEHNKRTKSEENEKRKIENELSQCTFHPNGRIPRRKISKFESVDFYKRNVEWQENKEAMIESKSQQIYSNLKTVRSPSKEKPKNRRVHSYGEHQFKTLINPDSATKNMEGGIDGIEELQNKKCAAKRKKLVKRNSCPQQQPPIKAISAAETLHQLLNIREYSPVREDIASGRSIFKKLEEKIAQISVQEGEKQLEKPHEKEINTVLNTLPLESKEPRSQFHYNEKIISNQKSKANIQQNKDLPITTAEFDATYLRENFNKITVKKNRYYIDNQASHTRESLSMALNSPIDNLTSHDESSISEKLPRRSSLRSNKSSRKSSCKRVRFAGDPPLTTPSELNSHQVNSKAYLTAYSTTKTAKYARTIRTDKGHRVIGQLNKRYQELLDKCQQVSALAQEYKSTHFLSE